MAKKAKVEGEVVVKDGTGSSIEFYEREFILDDNVPNKAMARSIIRKALIGEELRKTVTNYKRVRTCQIVSLEQAAVDEKAEGSKLEKLMLEAIELDCVPDNLEMYRSPESKEKAVSDAIKKKKEMAKRAKKKEKDNPVTDEGYVD